MLVKRTNLKVFTNKFVGNGPSSYKKKNIPGRGLTKAEKHCITVESTVTRATDFIRLLTSNAAHQWGRISYGLTETVCMSRITPAILK